MKLNLSIQWNISFGLMQKEMSLICIHMINYDWLIVHKNSLTIEMQIIIYNYICEEYMTKLA